MMSSVGDELMTPPVSFRVKRTVSIIPRLDIQRPGVFIYQDQDRVWPLGSPLPAWHFRGDSTSLVPLVCPSTTGLKYILPRHLVLRDALTSVLTSHCPLCTGTSIFSLLRTLNPAVVAMLDVNDFSKAPSGPLESQLVECPSRQVLKNRDEVPVGVVVSHADPRIAVAERGGNPEQIRESQRKRFARVEDVDDVIAMFEDHRKSES
jgi:hypothetical protein